MYVPVPGKRSKRGLSKLMDSIMGRCWRTRQPITLNILILFCGPVGHSAPQQSMQPFANILTSSCWFLTPYPDNNAQDDEHDYACDDYPLRGPNTDFARAVRLWWADYLTDPALHCAGPLILTSLS